MWDTVVSGSPMGAQQGPPFTKHMGGASDEAISGQLGRVGMKKSVETRSGLPHQGP